MPTLFFTFIVVENIMTPEPLYPLCMLHGKSNIMIQNGPYHFVICVKYLEGHEQESPLVQATKGQVVLQL